MKLTPTMAKAEVLHFSEIALGVVFWNIGYKFFITPLGLYSGGFTGIAQIIRGILENAAGRTFDFDLTGLLYWILNIPLMILGLKELGRMFMVRTIFTISLLSVLVAALPSPAAPLLSDRSLCCVIGGAIAGYGGGTILKNGGSSGGSDIIGLTVVKHRPDVSVGKLAILINIFVFGYAAVTKNFETAAYSALYSLVSSFVCDRTHFQTVKMCLFIVSSHPGIGKILTHHLSRGVTSWEAVGAYSGMRHDVHMIVLNRYELPRLRRELQEMDPHAFSIAVHPNAIFGNFKSHIGV